MDKIDFGKVLTINADCNLGRILALQEKVNELIDENTEIIYDYKELKRDYDEKMEWLDNYIKRTK